MKKKLLPALLVFAILLALVPSAALASGSVDIHLDTALVSCSAYTVEGNTVRLTDPDVNYRLYGSTTAYSIAADGGIAAAPMELSLYGVSIDLSGTDDASPIVIGSGSAVSLALFRYAGNGNVLRGGKNAAGIYVPRTEGGAAGSITIAEGEPGATLESYGGAFAAGIGGCGAEEAADCGDVTLSSGAISARGGYYAAGVGGGDGGNGGSVTITGSVLVASGGGSSDAEGNGGGAGIGGGTAGNGGAVAISGGMIVANGGGDRAGGDGIGGGSAGYGGAVTITGGSVKAAGGAEADDIDGAPVGASGEALTRVTLSFTDLSGAAVSAGAALDSLSVTDASGSPYSYGVSGVMLDGDGTVTAYLPEGAAVNGASVNGVSYVGSGGESGSFTLEQAVVEVTGITVTEAVYTGGTVRCTVLPENSTYRDVIWSLAPGNRLNGVSVTEGGVITASASGTALLRATVAQGSKSAFTTDIEVSVRTGALHRVILPETEHIGGTLICDNTSVLPGDSFTIVAKAEPGYKFTEYTLTQNGASVTVAGIIYEGIMGDGDVTVSNQQFTLDPVTPSALEVTVDGADNGKAEYTVLPHEGCVLLKFTPDPGFRFGGALVTETSGDDLVSYYIEASDLSGGYFALSPMAYAAIRVSDIAFTPDLSPFVQRVPVYFGSRDSQPMAWRILSQSGNDGNYSIAGGDAAHSRALLLLSEQTFATAGAASAEVYDSVAESCLTPAEKAALLITGKLDWEDDEFNSAAGSIAQKLLFPLSVQEATNAAYGLDTDVGRRAPDGCAWWLRSTLEADSSTYFVVSESGGIDTAAALTPHSARPAANLDEAGIAFFSRAEGSGGKAEGDGKLAFYTTANAPSLKLTLWDRSRTGLTVAQTSLSAMQGFDVTLSYSGAACGENEYLSALLCGEDGETLYYGRLKAIADETAASGSVTFTIPLELPAGNYRLKVYSEQYNGEKRTDLAGAMSAVSLTVEPAAPVLELNKAGCTVSLRDLLNEAEGGSIAVAWYGAQGEFLRTQTIAVSSLTEGLGEIASLPEASCVTAFLLDRDGAPIIDKVAG